MALNRTVGSTGNYAAGARLGFGVGDRDFLDSEQSKVGRYYRGLEFGSNKFLDRELFGVFGSGSRLAARGTDFFAPSPFEGGGKGQMQFFPLGYAASLIGGAGTPTAVVMRHLRATGLANRGSAGSQRSSNVRLVIRHPITAQDAYGKAFKSFDAPQKEKAAVEQIFGNAGFASAGRGNIINKQVFTRYVDQRTRRPAPVSSVQFRAKTGLLSGGALSGYTGSLAGIDRRFQRELVEINRLLAEGLAQEVARLQEDSIKRKQTVTGALINATLDRRNRFPN